ncbi:MAG: response regulator [Anaerolineales bacterium]|nr:response regulator [Anaerolineales bacterium]
MEPTQVLLVEPDSSSAAFIRHMLSRAGYEVEYAPSGKEGLIAAWRDQPDAIVLELDLPDIDGLEVVRKLRGDNRTRHTKILALTRHSEAEVTQRGMEAGIDHHIVKQTDAVDILLSTLAEEALHDVDDDDATPLSKPGRVMAFISAKGGQGTSSLCANIAHRIGEGDQESCVVTDLVLPLGSLAHIVGGDTSIDIVHLTTRVEPQQLNRSYLRSNLSTPRSWSFQFVPGARDPAAGAELDADRVAPVLQSLRSGYDQVLVDLGRTLSPITMLVLRQSAVITMVFSPDPPVVSNTRAVLDYLYRQGLSRDRFFLLSNRPLGTEDMQYEEAEAVLGRPIDHTIPNMGPNMPLTNRLNVPVELRFPEELGTQLIEEGSKKMIAKQVELAREPS